jgi:hypothetical protein
MRKDRKEEREDRKEGKAEVGGQRSGVRISARHRNGG